LILLVIDDYKTNWVQIFANAKDPQGELLRVEQGNWSDISLSSYFPGKCVVDLISRKANEQLCKTFCPDFLLIRMTTMEIGDVDHLNMIFGFQYAQIPSVNSLESIYNFLHRPWVFAQLIAIQKRLGSEAFPLIEQTYYSSFRQMLITPRYPIVVKVSHAHAGYGKMRLRDHHDFEDLRSMVALHNDYSTSEPFFEGEYDLRIQKNWKFLSSI